MAYEIVLPPQLGNFHSMFHVSQLTKYVHDPSHVLEMEDLQIKEDFLVEVHPIGIKDH